MNFGSLQKDIRTLFDVEQSRMFYRHDFIFWAGDLNYRLTEKYAPSKKPYFVPSDFDYQLLKDNEQLHLAIE